MFVAFVECAKRMWLCKPDGDLHVLPQILQTRSSLLIVSSILGGFVDLSSCSLVFTIGVTSPSFLKYSSGISILNIPSCSSQSIGMLLVSDISNPINFRKVKAEKLHPSPLLLQYSL